MIHSSSDKNFPIETLKDHQLYNTGSYHIFQNIRWTGLYTSSSYILKYFEDKVLENENLDILERFLMNKKLIWYVKKWVEIVLDTKELKIHAKLLSNQWKMKYQLGDYQQ